MRRVWVSAALIALTLAAVAAMVRREEAAVRARVVQVERGNVWQVTALTGRVAYEDERIVLAPADGVIEEVLVETGQRVAEGQILFRLDASGAERLVTAWIASGAQPLPAGAFDPQALLSATVVRAPANANVRRIMKTAGTPVAAGTPLAVVSSQKRKIVCTAQEADARDVRPGMDAVISLDGEALVTAVVTEVGEMTADDSTGRMYCLITLAPDEPLELPGGTAVDVDVKLRGRDGVTVLPAEAVTPRDTVWWVHGERCTEIPAKTVLSDEMHVWVALPEGTAVAIGEFHDGQKLTGVGQ